MSTLSIGQIYNAARQAGFTRSQALVATAVALAESSGNPANRCHNCFPGVTEDSRGLWQINVDAHPQYAGWNLYDPATNARAAFAVSSGGRNFKPWSTYTSGAYLGHLPSVYKALGVKHGAQLPDTVPGATVPAGGSGPADAHTVGFWHDLNPLNWFGSIGSAIGHDAARITLTSVFTIAGLGLVVTGLYVGVRPTVQKVQQQVAGGAAAVAKVAAV